MSPIIASLREQFTDLDSPLHRVATLLQADLAGTVAPAQRDGSPESTLPGRLDRSARVSASDMRGADVQTPGAVDHDRAARDAKRTLDSIDWSKPEISLWVPATGSHEIPASWRRAVEKGPDGQRTSLALVDYPAGVDFNDSVSTGMETLRLVLAGIAERGGTHRVTVAGHSQGAWVIGDTIDTPEVGRGVDRAVLFGHPAPARVDWSNDVDPNVRQVDDPQDPFTWDVVGGRDAIRAITELSEDAAAGGEALTMSDRLQRYGRVASAVLANPGLAAYLIGAHGLPEGRNNPEDPHNYDADYADGARFLAQ